MEPTDYNSTVYTWFEKTGIIASIRTQLRQNLVNALQAKDMTLNKLNTGPKSAKQYIYDLLIAEYLWNNNYAYALSVFASETPLLVNFREHASQSSDSPDKDGKHDKLQRDYVLHTLEALGINPEDSYGQLIISEYESNNVPLLLSILKTTCNSSPSDEARKIDEYGSTFIQNSGTQTDLSGNDASMEKNKIIAAKMKLLQQRDLYNTQLKEREEELIKRASVIEEQMMIVNEKLSHAHNMMQRVNAKERELAEQKVEERYIYRKKLELAREKSIDRENKRREKPHDSYEIFETNFKKLQAELAKVQEELSNKHRNVDCRVDNKTNREEIATQTETNDYSSNKKSTVDNEKLQLQSLVQRQQVRIEELNSHLTRLNRQLEEAQLTKSKVQFSKTNTILSESSSADDLIQYARRRMKHLEAEHLKADQSYLSCVTSLPL